MNITITEDRSRYKTTDFTWNVRIDGILIAVAKTPGAGDIVANEVQRRSDVVLLNNAIDALVRVEQAINAELAQRDGQALSALEAVDAAITAELAHTYDDSPQYGAAARFAEDPCCPCGMPALFFVQYPGKTYGYCPDCYRDLNAGRPPLLAQCASIIRRCLGSTTGAGSIIDELRRVDRALRAEGW